MARAPKIGGIRVSGDTHSFLSTHIAHAKANPISTPHVHVGRLTFHPHLVNHDYLRAKRAVGGHIPSNSHDLLKMTHTGRSTGIKLGHLKTGSSLGRAAKRDVPRLLKVKI